MIEGIFEYEIEVYEAGEGRSAAGAGRSHSVTGGTGFAGVDAASGQTGEEKVREPAPQEEDRGAVVLGIRQERRHLIVPERLGGVPVRRIAPHALSGKKQLRSVSFPASLRSVGAFALHNCPALEEVSLCDGIRDFHNGVLRQDTHLRRIHLRLTDGNYTVMRDILSDTDMRLQFLLELPDGEARLLFPGYDYAFEENTMARTIQFTISGSGMEYRECVRRKGIGFREYDRLFSRVVHDDPHAAVEIAADRLLSPYDLAPVHAETYTNYLMDHAGQALLQFVEELKIVSGGSSSEEIYERLRLMAEKGLITQEAADTALKEASEAGLVEAAGVILSGRDCSQDRETGTEPEPVKQTNTEMLTLDDW